jgi:hypothetical protein
MSKAAENTSLSTNNPSAVPGAQPSFVQLPRTPLVPEELLKRYGAYCGIDTRFRSAARLLQCLWLKDHGIATALSIGAEAHSGDRAFGSILSADAARAGKNFLTPAVHRLALQELLMREEDATIDEERLFANALSSMPMAFNLFGPLALDLDLATAVFRQLLPNFVNTVEQVQFEHSPGRREERFLADRTAFDLAIRVLTPTGERATIFVEVKYSENMEGPAAQMRDRYIEATGHVRLYRDPESAMLRSLAVEQLWREHMLSQLSVDHGITSRAIFMAIGPRLNRRVQAAFRVYEAELADIDQRESDRVAFMPLTLETVIEAIATAGASDLAHALWARYCDFGRIYQLSLQELVQTAGSNGKRTPALPPVRRRISPSTHRVNASSTSGHVSGRAAREAV